MPVDEYRVARLEERVNRVEERTEDVRVNINEIRNLWREVKRLREEDLKELADELASVRRALYTAALSVTGGVLITALTILQVFR